MFIVDVDISEIDTELLDSHCLSIVERQPINARETKRKEIVVYILQNFND